MTRANHSSTIHRLPEMLASILNTAFADALSTPFSLRVVGESDEQLAGTTTRIGLMLEGALCGECILEFDESHIAEFIAKDIAEPTDAGGDQKDLLPSIMDGVRERLAESLSSNGEQVTVELDLKPGSHREGERTISLVDPEAGPPIFQVLLHFSGSLLDDTRSAQPTLSRADGGSPRFGEANLKLVMDVELSVSLRFGTCKMPLSDVLELTSGSIVELDRRVEDSVELVLGGKVIARGEAVVIDGNYGLRVTEVSGAGADTFEQVLALSSRR